MAPAQRCAGAFFDFSIEFFLCKSEFRGFILGILGLNCTFAPNCRRNCML
jgi:hypothetical protein